MQVNFAESALKKVEIEVLLTFECHNDTRLQWQVNLGKYLTV